MTNSEMLQLEKNYLKNDDGSDLFFDETELYLYLQLAQMEVAAELVRKNLGYFETDATISFVDGTQEYSLESDIFLGKIRGVEWKNSTDYYYMCDEIRKVQRSISAG